MSLFSGSWLKTRSAAASTPAVRADAALVPAASIAGRALVTVVAIMTFLASLTAGIAIMIGDAASLWQDEVAREVTIQIKPQAGRNLELEAGKAVEIARRTPGVAAARAFSGEESEAVLAPWLGSGLDLDELPVPRLVVVSLEPGVAPDLERLRAELAESIPGAALDDHRLWLARLAIMARTVVLVAAIIFALVLTAMILAVAFATRGAMAGNREIIEVLHLVGAADDYISRQFQHHFLRLGLRGGMIGGILAILAFLLSSALSSWWRATPGGDQVEVMFGGFALGPNVYAAIALIAASLAVVTGFVSRIIVYRHLRGLN